MQRSGLGLASRIRGTGEQGHGEKGALFFFFLFSQSAISFYNIKGKRRAWRTRVRMPTCQPDLGSRSNKLATCVGAKGKVD